MMRLKALWISLCLLLACAGLAAFAVDGPSAGQAATSAGVKAFLGARLIDGSGLPAVENAALIARDGRVEAVGPASEVKTPAGAQTINLAGKFIIPGLISTHVHVSDVRGLRPPAYTEENTLRQLGVFARYGVTSVLSLGGEKESALRRATRRTRRRWTGREFTWRETLSPARRRRRRARWSPASPTRNQTSSRFALTTTSARRQRWRPKSTAR